MKTLSLDFESYYEKSGYSVRDLGNWRYCHDEKFQPLMASYCDGSEIVADSIENINWEVFRGASIIAHNAAFDAQVAKRLVEDGKIPDFIVNDCRWQCTANLSAYLTSARSLADASYLLEGTAVSKAVRDELSGKTAADLKSSGRWDAALQYAGEDARLCYNLWQNHSSKWSEFEQQLSSLTMQSCARGFSINTELLEDYLKKLEAAIFYLEKELPWVATGKKVTSPIAIAEQCREVKIPAPPVKSHYEDGDERYELWEATYGPRFPWVYAAGQWRQLNKLFKTLQTIKTRLRPDGTIDYSLLYFGAHTGRWSGGGSGFNVQNLRKVPIFLKGGRLAVPPSGLSYSDFGLWKAETDDALDVRKLIVPRPGKKLIVSDLSQIEPRVLAWLTGNEKLLGLIRSGMSIYEAFARTALGWNGGELKKENPEGYAMAKAQTLGLGYGVGAERFVSVASMYGVELTPEKSCEIVKAFRDTNPGITGLWKQMDDGLRRSVGSDFTVTLPSGRDMNYRRVRREIRSKKNAEGKYDRKYVVTVAQGTRRVEVYGARCVENLTQAVARDVFGTHLLELEKNVGCLLFSVHDEAVMEVEPDVTAKDVEAVMSQAPEWMPGLPVAAEAHEVPHYTK